MKWEINGKDKYFNLLEMIVKTGQIQNAKKGGSRFLINQTLEFNKREILELFKGVTIPKKLLEKELDLYMAGELDVKKYEADGINWWSYIGERFDNSYPDHFKNLSDLIRLIHIWKYLEYDKEKNDVGSKNWFIDLNTYGKTNQHACLSFIQIQYVKGEFHFSVYQRSADANLGLPCDLYQIYLIWEKHLSDLGSLGTIHFTYGNVHVYHNNVSLTTELYSKGKLPKGQRFHLNV